jgi:hypothetical protein
MIAGVMALVAGLALFSLARAPGANGQLLTVGIGNSGDATASTGGNTATGDNSSNDASSSSTSGGLINATVDLGGPSNTSSGTADVTTGPATATGNAADTGVVQTTDDSGSVFTPFFSQPAGQFVDVTNDGTATASTGGNTATGNNSDNTASLTQTATGGVLAGNVNLGAGPSNTSSGTATINTGPATAVGNTAANEVAQASAVGSPSGGFVAGTPFGPGVFPGTVTGFGSSFDPCSGRFFPFAPFAAAAIDNSGTATAGTGNNTAVGNNSSNTATVTQTASGGLIGLNINIGSPTNNSTGTATINTGAANATGNQSSNVVSQGQFCGQAAADTSLVARNPITGAPFAVPVIFADNGGQVVRAQALARTGIESSLALVAAALVVAGMALLLPARRRLAAEAGTSVRSSEWDDIVRW